MIAMDDALNIVIGLLCDICGSIRNAKNGTPGARVLMHAFAIYRPSGSGAFSPGVRLNAHPFFP